MTYEQTMAWGADQYADVIAALVEEGLPAHFTQTGGMNAAIMATLEGGYYLLVTDAEESLSWERAQRRGWFVGLYDHETGDAVKCEQDDDGETIDDLLAIVRRVMRPSP